MKDYNKQNKGIKIVEIVDSMKLHYSSLHQIGDITRATISEHINKGETEFYIKGKKGGRKAFYSNKTN